MVMYRQNIVCAKRPHYHSLLQILSMLALNCQSGFPFSSVTTGKKKTHVNIHVWLYVWDTYMQFIIYKYIMSYQMSENSFRLCKYNAVIVLFLAFFCVAFRELLKPKLNLNRCFSVAYLSPLSHIHTCLTSACRCLNWTHCSKCLLCCSAARSNSCCFSWRNSSRSWTRVAMSTSRSHNSSTPAESGHSVVLPTLKKVF